MSNVLSEEKKQQVIALGRLGWSLRRIERAAHLRRETAGAYLRAAGIAVRPPGGWGRNAPKPAIEALGPISINVRVTAVRKMADEAAYNGLLAPELTSGIARIKGRQITRSSRWELAVASAGAAAVEHPGRAEKKACATERCSQRDSAGSNCRALQGER